MMKKTLMAAYVCAAVVAAVPCAFAQEQEGGEAPAAKPVDDALQTEIKYAEALVDAGLPDFAQPVIAAAKKKWPGPEADTAFFAIEVRADLSLGKFEEARAKIAALPDRNGTKYWAAQLEMANNYNAQGQKKDCTDIYDAFFKKYPTPPKELKSFYLQASYAYGQILLGDKQFAKAAERYEGLLKLINKESGDEEDANTWCNVACETVEIYLRLASAEPDVKKRGKYLDPAKKLVDQLLWEQDRPVYFGRAIAFLAHVELLKGDVAKAQGTIDDYMDQLAELHSQIKEVDPDGHYGLLKQSPMPQCRFMLADMLWGEAQKEYKATPRNDEKVKSLLFGSIVSGKKRNGQGAYNHALNVFVQYPESAWAGQAGDMEKAIAEFATKNYGAKIQSKVTPEQMAKVRAMQFAAAHEKAAEGKYEEAIEEFLTTLGSYPEGKESIRALEAVAKAYTDLIVRNAGSPKIPEWRMNLDAVEGYISERFAGNRDSAVMTMAGDATMRLAAAEKQRGEVTRADTLQKAFYTNYRRHATAPNMAAAAASEAQKAEKWADAIALWELFGKYYRTNHFFPTSLSSLAYCYEKAGDRAMAIKTMLRYLDPKENPKVEDNQLRKAQTQMNLAMTYQRDGFDIVDAAATNETEEAANRQVAAGSAQIVRGIKQFQDFAAFADKMLADPGVTKEDKAKYSDLKEGALFLAGDSWRRLKKPEKSLPSFRQKAAANLETYVKQFPKGKYATKTYVLLGTLYTALGDLEKSKNALDRLTTQFPDSAEAKDAKPRLAKSLIEMGMDREASEIYAEMLKTDGNYTAWDFVRAGESLIEAKNWNLADQAFEKAIAKAATNQMSVVAKARIGQARSLYRQKNYAEAREALDAILDNEKLKGLRMAADANFLLMDVASEQGLREKNATLRNKHFGAAMGALRRLRDGFWKNEPEEKRDQLTIVSAEIRIRRMNAEEAIGQKDAAQDTGAGAATTLQSFIQSHGPTAELPLSDMKAAQVANLERAYALLVPLLSRLGPDMGGFVLKFGQEYLDMFPNGTARTEVQNCINQAKAAGAVLNEDVQAAAAAAAEAGAAEEAAQPAESITVVDEPAEDGQEPTSEGE